MSAKLFSRPLIALPLVFALGVWVGMGLSQDGLGGRKSTAIETTPAMISGAPMDESSKTGVGHDNLPIPKLSGLSPLETRRVLDGIVDSATRKAAIRQCLTGMPRDRWSSWMEGLLAPENRRIKKADIAGMAKRYGRMNEILGGIAAVDPVGFMAAQSSAGQRNNDVESEARVLIMMQWAEHDPAAARSFLTNQLASGHPPAGLSDAAEYVAGVMARQGGPGAIEWAATLPEKERAKATAAALSEIAVTAPQDAAKRLAELKEMPDLNAGTLAGDIASAWAKENPGEALVWAAAQSGALLKKGINGALGDWAGRDFDAALGAVRALPPEALTLGLSTMIGKAPLERAGEIATRWKYGYK